MKGDEKDQAAAPKSALKSARKSKGWAASHGFQLPSFSRLADPRKWSLKERFLVVTGVLLVLGNISLIIFLSMILEQNVERSAREQLRLVQAMAANELARRQDMVSAQALSVAAVPGNQELLAARNPSELRSGLLTYANDIRRSLGLTSLEFSFVLPAGEDFTSTSTAQETRTDDPLLARANRDLAPASGVVVVQGVPRIRAAVPVFSGETHLGAAAADASLGEIVERLLLPPEYGVALVLPEAGNRPAAFSGNIDLDLAEIGDASRLTDETRRQEDIFYRATAIEDAGGRGTALLLTTYDATALLDEKWNKINMFSWFFLSGALFLWIFLYLNVNRIEGFMRRLKKILTSSHSNYFAERFESDHVHCLDLMHCHNEECPVYQNPSLICYLETGSEAISPLWRNTCLFLNKYEECKNCPVYQTRVGDELSEMRNVVNTMMRLWGNFLSRVGHLLAYVLRSQETTGQLPSLDEISSRLEQMAKLTFFSHDLQGVLERDEVYQQLCHMFEKNFNMRRYVLFEVDHESDRIVLAKDKVPELPLCKHNVLLSADSCRACRVAEDVVSFYNEVLCPHFNADHATDVRCCLPMVMSGKVGAVFSFLAPRRDWEMIRKQIPVMRKYLDEAAPVLNSLSLLKMSKEQALRDPLTRCHNRRFLDEFITKYEPLCEREGKKTGLLMADVDYFKQVNDEHGHETGDAVLQQVVSIIQNNIRKTDLLIRYGGEEFLVLLQNVEKDASIIIAEKIRSMVEQHAFDIPGGGKLKKTISLGVAEFPDDAKAMYKAIKFADVALYSAKNTGRNKVVRFTQDMWTDESY